MSLNHYGVAIGSLVSFTRDPQHDFGHWYHGHVQLDAAGTPWTSALDVDAPSAVGVLYRLVTDLHVSDLGPVGSLSNGFHELLHTDASGALDYVRSHALRDGWMVRWIRDRVLKQRAPADWSPPPANVGKPGGPDPAAFAPAPFGPHPIDSWLDVERRVRW